MKRIQAKNFAQIKDIDVTLGDMTLFIGPQASGKSLFLQMIKLIANSGIIVKTLKREGYNWNGDASKFLELYFGENMGRAWNGKTRITLNKTAITIDNLIHKRSDSESVFYIPAQRVMTLDQGWPRNFKNFKIGDPFIVKHFSENLRLLMEAGLGGKTGPIFPQTIV
jgi:predicted ATP-dependent endonuclease of OLD family